MHAVNLAAVHMRHCAVRMCWCVILDNRERRMQPQALNPTIETKDFVEVPLVHAVSKPCLLYTSDAADE